MGAKSEANTIYLIDLETSERIPQDQGGTRTFILTQFYCTSPFSLEIRGLFKKFMRNAYYEKSTHGLNNFFVHENEFML